MEKIERIILPYCSVKFPIFNLIIIICFHFSHLPTLVPRLLEVSKLSAPISVGKGRISYITKLLLKSFLLYKETFIVQNMFACVGGGVGEGGHGGVEWGREGMGRGGVGEGGHG